MCEGKKWIFPIALIIIISYFIFGYLWFSIEYIQNIKFLENISEKGKLVLSIFSMGALGGTVYVSIYFAHEYNEVFHEKDKDNIPICLDFMGYIIYILRSGIIGIIFYFIFKAGLFMILTDSKIEINSFATLLIAFAGGFANTKVIKFLDNFVRDTVDPKNKNKKNIIER